MEILEMTIRPERNGVPDEVREFPNPMDVVGTERDALFKAFASAILRRDMDALYKVVTPDFLWSYHDGVSVTKALANRAAVLEHAEEKKRRYSASKFHHVVYHHLPDVSFMTFHVSETLRETGEHREQIGIERYTFHDGKIATKDVYRKPI